MIIDIDIAISDENGNRIHHFARRFDEKNNITKDSSETGETKEKFEDFLTEYLSSTGRVIRDKLINDLEEKKENKAAKDGPGISELIEGEVEYKISIGNENVLIGKIPLSRLERINKINDDLNKLEQADNVNFEDRQIGVGLAYNMSGLNMENRGREIKEIEASLSNLMSQALQRYESSFYISGSKEEQTSQKDIKE